MGLCEKCQFGVCSGPEYCECFYGYEGHSCDIAKSYPTCNNGVATSPDVCACEEGWTGRICDQAVCLDKVKLSDEILIGQQTWAELKIEAMDVNYTAELAYTDLTDKRKDLVNALIEAQAAQEDMNELKVTRYTGNGCGEHGHCIKPSFCECDIAWYSSDVTSQCDKLDIRMHDPNCVEGDNYKCTKCEWEYFHNPVTNLCGKCSEEYDEHCLECDEKQCLEC